MTVELDPIEAAHAAGLRYVVDAEPGIRRRRAGRGFAYVDAQGHAVKDEATLARIKALAIPPAWRDVWICPSPRGHLQATGRDARGRKQYRYHPRWRATRDATKYGKLLDFGAALPRIRRRVEADLGAHELSREKVLAAVVRLMDLTHVRVGNEEYARENGSFGLTTLRNRHARVRGATVHLHFRGKSGKQHACDLHDRRIARIVRRCQELPGQELFEYVDEHGEPHDVGSADVNDYLHAVAGDELTAKDFRTWAGSVLALDLLGRREPGGSETARKHEVVEAVKEVAERLGNTPAVCRKCYVHPAVLDAYAAGTLPRLRESDDPERALLAFLRRAAKEKRRAA